MTQINDLAREYRKEKSRARRLRANWTIEPQQDLLVFHDPRVEQEWIEALSQEISSEIDEAFQKKIDAIQLNIKIEKLPCKKNY